MSLVLFSCEKSTDISGNSNSDNQSNLLNSKIDVTVSVCENLFCTEIKKLSNIEVSLQIEGSDSFYKMAISDEFGKILFSPVNDSRIIVNAKHNGQEFQEKITVGRNEVIHIDILFSPFCEMEGPKKLVNCNTKIDFEHMSVGQKSKYVVYKTNVKQLNEDKSFYYTGDTLILEVIERINETEWSVKEQFSGETSDSLFEYIVNTKPTICVWDVRSDFMKIYPLTGNEPSNFTPLRTSDYETYKIPFVAEGFNICELDKWYPSNCGNNGTPRFNDLEINGKIYNRELILDRRYGIDIPQLGVIYNREEGFVHTYTFGTMQYTHAYGFDLINE